MSVLTSIMRFVGLPYGRRSRGTAASRREVLSAKPLRHPAVSWRETEEGEVVLTIPLARGRMSAALQRVFPRPDTKRLALDEVGGFVWQLCDGQTTVQRICHRLSERYNLDHREAEASMLEYLKQLARRGLVVARSGETAPETEPPAPRAGRKRRKR